MDKNKLIDLLVELDDSVQQKEVARKNRALSGIDYGILVDNDEFALVYQEYNSRYEKCFQLLSDAIKNMDDKTEDKMDDQLDTVLYSAEYLEFIVASNKESLTAFVKCAYDMAKKGVYNYQYHLFLDEFDLKYLRKLGYVIVVHELASIQIIYDVTI